MPPRLLNCEALSVRVELAEGETLALLGAAGAGKSALLRALSGERVTRLEPLRPDLTLGQNMALGASGPAASARVAYWLHALGLTGVAGMCPPGLGADALCRARLGRALVGDPLVLLLDEPFRGCEPDQRRRLGEALRRLQVRSGLGIVLATGYPPEARALADRVLVLRDGAMVQEGETVAVYERPAGAYAARCLGEVNLLPGRVDMIEDDTAFVSLANGARVEAMVADAGPGPCVIALRPERIALADMAPEELGAGAVAAQVEARVHHGDHIRLVLQVLGSRVVVRRPPGPSPAPGRTVSIAWQAVDAHACRPEADRPGFIPL